MQRGEFEPPHKLQPVVPEWAGSIISSMLAWDPAARPSAEDAIKAWDRKAILVAKSAKAPTTRPVAAVTTPAAPASSVPPWIRLRHDSGASMSFSSDETQVTRQLFNGPFRTVTCDSGHPVAAYFPSDDVTALFTVKKEADGWKITGSNHRNNGILNGTPLDNTRWDTLKDGDQLAIYSRNNAGTVASFTFEVPK
jgi:serine/threonine protein kinase